jgi:hypothetical protein
MAVDALGRPLKLTAKLTLALARLRSNAALTPVLEGLTPSHAAPTRPVFSRSCAA